MSFRACEEANDTKLATTTCLHGRTEASAPYGWSDRGGCLWAANRGTLSDDKEETKETAVRSCSKLTWIT